jgi:murein DD-endopeptidase MepM/ murein hydrolase activator NlpD
MEGKKNFCRLFFYILIGFFSTQNAFARVEFKKNKTEKKDTLSSTFASSEIAIARVDELNDDLIHNYIDSLFELDAISPELISQINTFLSIKGKSDEEIYSLIDSLFELKNIPFALINQINYYVATRQENFEDVNYNNVALTAFYDNSLYPANCFYESWDTKNTHPYSSELWETDSTLTLVLSDKENYCNYIHPFNGPITSNFGWRDGKNHNGVDIDLWTGAPVKAAFDGMVRVARNQGGYGNVVVVRHYNGLETLYAHLHKIKVKPGQVINAGQVIGLGGNTGKSTGSHLHFEIRFKGKPINPKHLISFQEKELHSDAFVFTKNKYSYAAYPEGTKFHTIKKGDYLYAIAERYGITVKKICDLNEINKKTALKLGQQLRIN